MDSEDDDDSSEGEDLLAHLGSTPNESFEPRTSRVRTEVSDLGSTSEPTLSISTNIKPEPPIQETAMPSQTSAEIPTPTQTSQTLRSRPTTSPSTTTSTAHSTARAALFANRRKLATPQTSTATAEAILDHQRAEQDGLSESILKMAGALKASSHKFSDTLEADKEVVGRAGEGMDKTERGMEAARGGWGLYAG